MESNSDITLDREGEPAPLADPPAFPPHVAAALVEAHALAALAAGECLSSSLFLPHVVAQLRVDPTTGRVFVVDQDGHRRHGVNAAHVVGALRAEYGRPFFRFAPPSITR